MLATSASAFVTHLGDLVTGWTGVYETTFDLLPRSSSSFVLTARFNAGYSFKKELKGPERKRITRGRGGRKGVIHCIVTLTKWICRFKEFQ